MSTKLFEKKGKSAYKTIPSAVIYLVFFLLLFEVINAKNDFHVDEIYSYSLSNSPDGLFLQIEDGVRYSPVNELTDGYLTVSEENRFHYDMVYVNQKSDVPPPVYYMILHTICSLFPNTFSIWFAASINIVSLMLTLYFQRRILRKLELTEDVIFLISFAYVTSSGILGSAAFLRMYCLTQLMVSMITCCFIELTEDFSTRNLVILFLVSVVSALTHYYCIIYLVAMSVFAGVRMLCRKEYKNTLSFSLVMAGAGVNSIILFPAMIKHMFLEKRGAQSIVNLKNSPFLTRCFQYFQIVNTQLFGRLLLLFLVFSFIMILINRTQGTSIKNKVKTIYEMIFFTVAVYFVFVSKTAVYISGRYMYPIYSILLISFLSLFFQEAENCMKNVKWRQVLYVLIVIAVSILALINNNWQYVYPERRDDMNMIDGMSKYDCYCIYDQNQWRLYPQLNEFNHYNGLTVFNMAKYDKKDIISQISGDSCILTVIMKSDHETDEYDAYVSKVLAMLDDDYVADEIGFHGYGKSYFIHR